MVVEFKSWLGRAKRAKLTALIFEILLGNERELLLPEFCLGYAGMASWVESVSRLFVNPKT